MVFDEPMLEIHLSGPLLQALGFDLDEHLNVVRDKYDDCDFSHIGFSPSADQAENVSESTEHPSGTGQLSELLLAPVTISQPPLPIDSLPRSRPDQTASMSTLHVWNSESRSDSMDFETVDVGTHDPDEMSPYLEDMIAKGKENGFPRGSIGHSLTLSRNMQICSESDLDRIRLRIFHP